MATGQAALAYVDSSPVHFPVFREWGKGKKKSERKVVCLADEHRHAHKCATLFFINIQTPILRLKILILYTLFPLLPGHAAQVLPCLAVVHLDRRFLFGFSRLVGHGVCVRDSIFYVKPFIKVEHKREISCTAFKKLRDARSRQSSLTRAWSSLRS